MLLLMQKAFLLKILSIFKVFAYFLPALVWAILIWSLSTTTSLPPIPWDFLSPDKIGHLVFYCIETLLLIIAFAKSQQWTTNRSIWILFAMLLAAAYGTMLEFVQAEIPGRSFDYADMLANFVGTIIGVILYYKLGSKYILSSLPKNKNDV